MRTFVDEWREELEELTVLRHHLTEVLLFNTAPWSRQHKCCRAYWAMAGKRMARLTLMLAVGGPDHEKMAGSPVRRRHDSESGRRAFAALGIAMPAKPTGSASSPSGLASAKQVIETLPLWSSQQGDE